MATHALHALLASLCCFPCFAAPVPGGGDCPGDEDLALFPVGPQPDDRFGSAVALAGSYAVVGAPEHDGFTGSEGAAYLFDAVTGLQLAKLEPTDGSNHKRLGRSVAIDGSTVIVGAPGGAPGGIAYLFAAPGGEHLATLFVGPGGTGSEFGGSVDIDGTLAAVGARHDSEAEYTAGAVHLFDVVTGQRIAKLFAEDPVPVEWFGSAVALAGTTLAVGAPGHDGPGPEVGSVYLFDVPSGQQRARLAPDDGQPGDRFGRYVALHGTTLVVASPYHLDPAGHPGAAYVFDAASGQQLAKLLPTDPVEIGSGAFAGSVSVHGTTAIIGAACYDGPCPGCVYLFDVPSGDEIARLTHSGATEVDGFGSPAAIHGTTAVVGAPSDDQAAPDAGAAYVFDATRVRATPYCFGAGGGTACPCGNTGAPGSGCGNSAFPDGARLWRTGSTRISADDLQLRVSRSRPGTLGLFFQGDAAVGGDSGTPFGDGLRCAGGATTRLETTAADAGGEVASSVLIGATGGASAGDLLRYQWWYRDPVPSPCGTGFNLSNGLAVEWGL